MQALSEEKQKQILFIIALVGCVTGLASLGWNIYAATRPTLDKIAVTIPWLRVAEKDRLRIEVSNLGEKDVHIRAFFLVPHRVASFEQLYPKSGVSTIPPGGFQIFE